MQCYCVKCLIMFCELMVVFFLALLLPLLALCEEKKISGENMI